MRRQTDEEIETEAEQEKRRDEELEAVIDLMRDDYPLVADYHVETDDIVRILDANDNILGTITCDRLTRYWNRMEG